MEVREWGSGWWLGMATGKVAADLESAIRESLNIVIALE